MTAEQRFSPQLFSRRGMMGLAAGAALLPGIVPGHVFAAGLDPGFYRPYPADATPTQRHPRFEDILFRDADGWLTGTQDFRGRVAFLHIWGSWCPPCVSELPILNRLHQHYAKNEGIAFAFLNAVEAYATSAAFLAKLQLSLPQYDTMTLQEDVPRFRNFTNARGQKRKMLEDFQIRYYPTTLLLDRNGLYLVFYGRPNKNWLDWIPLLDDMIANTAPFTGNAPKDAPWLHGAWNGEVAGLNGGQAATRSLVLTAQDGASLRAAWSGTMDTAANTPVTLGYVNKDEAYLTFTTAEGARCLLTAKADGTMTGAYQPDKGAAPMAVVMKRG